MPSGELSIWEDGVNRPPRPATEWERDVIRGGYESSISILAAADDTQVENPDESCPACKAGYTPYRGAPLSLRPPHSTENYCLPCFEQYCKYYGELYTLSYPF